MKRESEEDRMKREFHMNFPFGGRFDMKNRMSETAREGERERERERVECKKYKER